MYTHKLTTFFSQNSIAQGWLKNSYGQAIALKQNSPLTMS